MVLNCTGVWTDEIQALSGGRGRFRVRASKGVHIVVPREKITGDAGLILRTASSVLFVIPWKNHWLIGTTDTDWNLDLAHPAATKSDIDYLLDCVNEVLVSPLTHDDIDGVYAGLRPLLAGESEETSALSREHAVARVVPGLISIAGGKYTTYRVMAADAVDAGAEDLPRRVAPSCTDRVPLLGADGYFAMRNQVDALAGEYGLHPHRVRNVLNRYGSMIRDVLDPGLLDPALLATVPDAPDYLMAEIRYAVTHEGALHLEDVLTRRTRISIEYPHRGVACAQAVADAGRRHPRLGRGDAHPRGRHLRRPGRGRARVAVPLRRRGRRRRAHRRARGRAAFLDAPALEPFGASPATCRQVCTSATRALQSSRSVFLSIGSSSRAVSASSRQNAASSPSSSAPRADGLRRS